MASPRKMGARARASAREIFILGGSDSAMRDWLENRFSGVLV
jgi:hypothetical protein